jgi:hypothetical protein
MSTCDEFYQRSSSSLAERFATSISDFATHLAQRVETAREIFIKQRRLRATETALDGLPEHMRCDIGWPDLYERQVGERDELGKARQ